MPERPNVPELDGRPTLGLRTVPVRDGPADRPLPTAPAREPALGRRAAGLREALVVRVGLTLGWLTMPGRARGTLLVGAGGTRFTIGPCATGMRVAELLRVGGTRLTVGARVGGARLTVGARVGAR
jgi:hypothetical protein